MARVVDVANYICIAYKAMAGNPIDELKLHKLLYFSQKRYLALEGAPLFPELMEGWIHGPVSTEVRSLFNQQGKIVSNDLKELTPFEKQIINDTLHVYGRYESWSLRNMSHQESSWINSRKGLTSSEMGFKKISIEDIKKDAEKIRPFDYSWGMYYDEHEDVVDGVGENVCQEVLDA